MTRLLLIHGLGGTGATMDRLGAHLAAAGHEVHAPTLPGHGTDPSHLVGVGWDDWVRAVREWCATWSIDAIVGQSMGGALALAVAADPERIDTEHIDTVRRVVAINTPVPDPDAVDGLEWRRSRGHTTIEGAALADGEVGYTSMPLEALLEMATGLLRLPLARVTVPVLLVNGALDDVVDPTTAAALRRALTGTVVEHVLPHTGHVATLGPDLEALTATILAFIAAHG